jgi:hypothetical protein
MLYPRDLSQNVSFEVVMRKGGTVVLDGMVVRCIRWTLIR